MAWAWPHMSLEPGATNQRINKLIEHQKRIHSIISNSSIDNIQDLGYVADNNSLVRGLPRQRVPTTGADNGYRQRVPTMGTDNGYRQLVPTMGTTKGLINCINQLVSKFTK